MSISQTFDQYLSRLLELDPDMAGELVEARAELDQMLRRERAERPPGTSLGPIVGYIRERFRGGWMWDPITASSLTSASPPSGEPEVEPTATLDETTNQLVIEAGPRYAGGEALLHEVPERERQAIVGQVALDAEGRGVLAIPEDGTGFQVELIEPDRE